MGDESIKGKGMQLIRLSGLSAESFTASPAFAEPTDHKAS